MKKSKKLLFAPLLAAAGAGMVLIILNQIKKKRKKEDPELQVTSFVDLDRYTGTWFDIAHLPASFLKNRYNIRAHYTLQQDGTVKVVNSCTKGSVHGKLEEVEGIAHVTDPATNAKLKVEFFWPFQGDYWIIEIGDQYEYALVGEPSRKYLWLLSRETHLDEEVMGRLVHRANEEGFETHNLIMTRHQIRQTSSAN